MDVSVRELDRHEATLQAVFQVCQSSFPTISIDKLRTNWIESSPSSTFFGAYSGTRLVAVNGFIAHSMLLDGSQGIAYQSCWTATQPDYRGKGLFSKIINHAKEALSGRAAFICGFPNSVSGPIFTGKLGFSEVPMTRAIYLTRGPSVLLHGQLSPTRYFERVMSPKLVKFDQHECAVWKKREHCSDFLEVEHNTNYIWGTLATKRVAGVSVKAMLVGGCEINKPQLLSNLLKLAAHSSGVSMLRFVCCRDSLIASSSRLLFAGGRTEPFIHFPIDMPTGGLTFDAHTGMKDVF